MICDTWWGVNILSKVQLPSSYRFRLTCLEYSELKDDLIELMNQLITSLFVEQLKLNPVCTCHDKTGASDRKSIGVYLDIYFTGSRADKKACVIGLSCLHWSAGGDCMYN